MKRLVSKISFICLSTTILFAVDISPIDTQSNVSGLVSEIKRAKPENKRALINQLKIKLRGLNHEVRQKTMMDLRSSFSKDGTQHQYRKNKNCPMNSQERSENMQQTGQRGGKRTGPRDGSGPHYNDKPHKNNGQQNRGR